MEMSKNLKKTLMVGASALMMLTACGGAMNAMHSNVHADDASIFAQANANRKTDTAREEAGIVDHYKNSPEDAQFAKKNDPDEYNQALENAPSKSVKKIIENAGNGIATPSDNQTKHSQYNPTTKHIRNKSNTNKSAKRTSYKKNNSHLVVNNGKKRKTTPKKSNVQKNTRKRAKTTSQSNLRKQFNALQRKMNQLKKQMNAIKNKMNSKRSKKTTKKVTKKTRKSRKGRKGTKRSHAKKQLRFVFHKK